MSARFGLCAVVLLAAGCGGGSSSTPPPQTASHAEPIAAKPEVPTVSGASLVQFPSRDADLTKGEPTKLDGWLFKPKGAGPFPAVIALHGCAGLFDAEKKDFTARHRDWAERFTGAGYAVLFPDSFNPRGTPEICTKHTREIRSLYERTRDAYGALEWLQSQSFVKADRVAIMGWSNGAITALGAVAAETHARPKKLTHDFRVSIGFYPACKSVLERPNWMPPVAPVHVLVGELDDWTPPEQCKVLAEQAHAGGAQVDITVYPGAYHDFDDPNMPVHVRKNVATTASGTATLGTNPVARADSIQKTMKWLEGALAP